MLEAVGQVSAEIDTAQLGQTGEVAAVDCRRGLWKGWVRTRRIVVFDPGVDLRKRLVPSRVDRIGVWRQVDSRILLREKVIPA